MVFRETSSKSRSENGREEFYSIPFLEFRTISYYGWKQLCNHVGGEIFYTWRCARCKGKIS